MNNPAIVVAATIKHTATLIFLHGLGDTGQRWSRELEAIREPYMKIICPTANTIPVTLNNEMDMPAWFDVDRLDASALEDEYGIKGAATSIHKMIKDEINGGIPSERIIIGGFSQGGGLALYSGLTFQKKLAAIVALSCWLPLGEKLSPSVVIDNKDVPILQCHGDGDDIVRYSYGKSTSSLLSKFSKNVDFKTYVGLMHTVSPEEMDDIKNFMKTHLPPI